MSELNVLFETNFSLVEKDYFDRFVTIHLF